ncbi:MAG: LysR family transcriptional regulator [Erysipelotrichaceae bacterium]|jgi:DNA-binding transcriptional LysR family regulator|nr:LysR family transcriptional regulator [Erysipelotrichaceae bacterium]MCH4045786.1 LysR family transcriptional regulator [Erysipelotrichaceae bacterium]MCH4122994.1 LysR family transcriptional regulator [Erysipelotrichaceae bacterium]MCI1384695.1 LysR family transcriptional regulator [Solobacterium sp.]
MSEANSLLDLKKIKSFLAVADAHSFSKAAYHMGYSTAALSIQVKDLEDSMGVKLLDRYSGNQVTLTNDGSKFYSYASTLLTLNDEIIASFTDKSELSGTIRIGAIDSICDCMLTDLIASYHTKYPKVTIIVSSYSPRMLLKLLEANEIDIAIFVDKPVANSKFVVSEKISEDIVFCCAPDYPFAHLIHPSIDSLLQYPAVLTEKNESYRNTFEEVLAENGMVLSPIIESKSTRLIIDLLIKEIGYSVLPKFLIQNEEKENKIVPVEIPGIKMNIQLQVLYNSNKYISKELREFIRFAKSYIGR